MSIRPCHRRFCFQNLWVILAVASSVLHHDDFGMIYAETPTGSFNMLANYRPLTRTSLTAIFIIQKSPTFANDLHFANAGQDKKLQGLRVNYSTDTELRRRVVQIAPVHAHLAIGAEAHARHATDRMARTRTECYTLNIKVFACFSKVL